MEKLIKKLRLSYTIELISGLHIGGSSDNVEIGGIDCPVIKIATRKNQPYIPGSSIKGKMRCLLEQLKGTEGDKEINLLFGPKGDNASATRLIVRDAYLTEESEKMLLNNDALNMPYTEIKFENSIDRVKGTAKDPRQIERVPAGAEFKAEFIINVWDNDDEKAMIDLLNRGICAIENDYLGGSGTRGYGQVRFKETGQPESITFDQP